jgi:hypothetical protein
LSCDSLSADASLLNLSTEIEFLCAVACADLLLVQPPTMVALASGACTQQPPAELVDIALSWPCSFMFLSQLLPLLHAKGVSLSDVAVPVLVPHFQAASLIFISFG